LRILVTLTQEKNMKPHYIIGALMLIAITVLAGCAAPRQTSTPYYSSAPSSSRFHNGYGVIESIQVAPQEPGSSGTGAVVGGLIGGLLGNQIGSGGGKSAATVVGAVGGAVVGNSVEKNRNQQEQSRYQIRVRLDNGDTTEVLQDNINDLRVGSRVRIHDGHVYGN
jgi:outer membrane lipoprotein SlyB